MDYFLSIVTGALLAIGALTIVLAVLGLLIGAIYWGILELVHMIRFRKSRRKKLQQFSGKDRELLDLIGDLAELYRSTGR